MAKNKFDARRDLCHFRRFKPATSCIAPLLLTCIQHTLPSVEYNSRYNIRCGKRQFNVLKQRGQNFIHIQSKILKFYINLQRFKGGYVQPRRLCLLTTTKHQGVSNSIKNVLPSCSLMNTWA